MPESWSTGARAKRCGHRREADLQAQAPPLQAHPAARATGGPGARPCGSRAGDSVSLLSHRTQTHLPGAPASWLGSDIPRRAGGGGCRLRSRLGPPGPLQPTGPTPLPGHPLPTHPLGPQSPGGHPASGTPRRAPPCRGGPHARSHPGLLGGAGRVSERRKGGLGEGGSGSGPTCISVPAVSSGGGGSSRSLPLPPPRDGLPARLCEGSGTPSRHRRKRP